MRSEDIKLTESELEAESDFIAACRMNIPMGSADVKAAKAERAKGRNRIASSESHRRARMSRKAGEDG